MLTGQALDKALHQCAVIFREGDAARKFAGPLADPDQNVFKDEVWLIITGQLECGFCEINLLVVVQEPGKFGILFELKYLLKVHQRRTLSGGTGRIQERVSCRRGGHLPWNLFLTDDRG
ncbi:MAG: hypothetical protein RLO18_29665, partial [Gimesia chilikensis]